MAKIGKILGSVSPLYGAVSGEGLFGKGLSALGDALGPNAGVLPALASSANKRRKRKADGTEEETAPAMRKGGKVKKMAKGGAVTRGDGIARKGHTKGKVR